ATFTSNRQFNLGAGNDTFEVKNFADTNPSFGVGGAPARPAPHLNTFTIAGLLTGSGALVKEGDGRLVLSNLSNNYSGGTFVNGGTLSVSNGAALGLGTTSLCINGGTISATSNAALGALTPSAGSPLYAIHMANGGTLQTSFNSVGDFRQLDLVSGVSTLDVTAGFVQQRDALVYGAGGFVKTG